MTQKVEVVPYDHNWSTSFEKEKQAFIGLGLTTISQIHHIGSTAVEGLAAKPIINILLEAKSLAVLDHNQEKIESLGYESMGEFGIK